MNPGDRIEFLSRNGQVRAATFVRTVSEDEDEELIEVHCHDSSCPICITRDRVIKRINKEKSK